MDFFRVFDKPCPHDYNEDSFVYDILSERTEMIKLGFIGFGLIGASVAKALKAKKPGQYSIYVYDYHKDANPSLEKAVADGCIDSLR